MVHCVCKYLLCKDRFTYLQLTYCVCVSERVGWVPADTEVPEAVKSTYKWIEGLSVTEMEIMHGAYRKDNPNGALCMVGQKCNSFGAVYDVFVLFFAIVACL